MKRICARKIICLILTLIPLSAFAIPAIDLSRFVDNDMTTIDKVTGLEWLDVPLTHGRSYYDVAEQCSSGGEFAGYRFATGAEVSEIFDAFQFPEWRQTFIHPDAHHFMALFGETYRYESELINIVDTRGYVASEATLTEEVPTVEVYSVELYNVSWNGPATLVSRGHPGFDPAWTYNSMGSFLVRKFSDEPVAVPEINAGTAPIALSLLLLAALMRWERRRAAKL